ncbi:DUF418 domain-containing protein [Sphingomonas mucosissima]|uniref:DUF418 domain-containing protein n=1 Tax=Sphingomonas mucosissima TaxID=370959 RepID=A0A245ZR63_9SPHN|nr:DUF418 domain-containing protein [Sphingomonas mucosissima]OWK32233.1 hypothetical protein SPMU_05550 [Sphingomonas mucosissima]
MRGFAVMGILLLNIISFAMPRYAYADPTFYGGASGANWWAWAITFVLAEGKMRGLFTMLFGASTILIAERTLASPGSPARRHYARMISLLAIGMVHAYLIWSGDILVLYALCGGMVFLAWRWDTPRLIAVAALLLAAQLASGAMDYAAARQFEDLATAPGAPPAIREQWERYRSGVDQLRDSGAAEVEAFRGGWAQALPMRIAITSEAQRTALPATIPETIALMLLGMALYRSGFFSGTWPSRWYRGVLITGYGICLPLYLPLVRWIDARHFDPIALLLSEPLHLVLLRPGLALAHAALIIQVAVSGACRPLTRRLAAVGRLAFSNYLGTSLICTYLFCGYGLGWFGYLERWQLYPIVAALWLLMLLWSPLWLARFAHGPFEWLWRSLSQRRIQPLRRRHPL